MSLGLVGRKVGMMRIFRDDGTSVPVTVIDCSGNRVAQVKSADANGDSAVQVAFAGTTIGKGYAGVIKRYYFSSNRASHGNSLSHNSPGSIGMAQDPGRVFPGKRMAGHLGDVNRTVQLLEVVRVDAERS